MKFDRLRPARIQRTANPADGLWDEREQAGAGGPAGGASHHLDRIAIAAEDALGPAAPSPLQARTDRQSLPFSVVIPRSEAGEGLNGGADRPRSVPIAVPGSAERDDAGGGGKRVDEEVLKLTQLPLPLADLPDLQEGQSISLPDVIIPDLAKIEEGDKIGSTLTYQPTITQESAEPNGSDLFGVTHGYDIRLTGISLTASAGAFVVKATVVNPITYKVRSDKGPDGQINITSESDRAIHAGNYQDVSTALMPDMSDHNGRPKRNGFWAKDLTIIHEQFHATEGREHAKGGVVLAQNRLNAQQAANANEVQTLIAQVPAIVAETRRAAMAYPGREERAYRDGAPLYRARATAILVKGDNEEYPDPPGGKKDKDAKKRKGR